MKPWGDLDECLFLVYLTSWMALSRRLRMRLTLPTACGGRSKAMLGALSMEGALIILIPDTNNYEK